MLVAHTEKDVLMLAILVDYVIVTGNSKKLYRNIIAYIKREYRIRELENLGISFQRVKTQEGMRLEANQTRATYV